MAEPLPPMSNRVSLAPELPKKTHLAEHDVYDATSRSVKFSSLPPTLKPEFMPSVHRESVPSFLPTTNLFLVHNVLTSEECQHLIKSTAGALACAFPFFVQT